MKVSVIETSLNEGCVDNKLTILDDTPENQNSSLKCTVWTIILPSKQQTSDQ